MDIIQHLIDNRRAYLKVCKRYMHDTYEDAYHDLILYWHDKPALPQRPVNAPRGIMKYSIRYLKTLSTRKLHHRKTEMPFSSLEQYARRGDNTQTDDSTRQRIKLLHLDTIEQHKPLLTPYQLNLLEGLANVNYCCWCLAAHTGISKSTVYRQFAEIADILKNGEPARLKYLNADKRRRRNKTTNTN